MATTKTLLNTPCVAPKPGLTGYTIHGCKCWQCSTAHRRYELHRDRAIAYGRWKPFVPADTVRSHINTLRAAGLGVDRVATLSGVSRGVISHILWTKNGNPTRQNVLTRTAQRILAVKPDPENIADGRAVSATATRRRVEALMVAGWPAKTQAEMIGCNPAHYQRAISKETVSARHARAVQALYDRLGGTPAPDGWVNRRTRRLAAARGMAPAAAWDDDTIGDPDATPNLGVDAPPDEDVDDALVNKVLAGKRPATDLNPAEQHALWQAWIRRRRARNLPGSGISDFCRTVGITRAQGSRLRDQQGDHL